MRIYKEESLRYFDFWSGGASNAEELDYDQLDELEAILEDMYPDGMTATELNDLMWFDFDTVKEWLGIEDSDDEDEFDEGCHKEACHKKEEEDEVEEGCKGRKTKKEMRMPKVSKLTIKEDTNKPYIYFTKHGIGPGMLPRDVKVLDWYDVNNYITLIYTNRFLTTDELNDYDIYPETKNDELMDRYNLELDPKTGKVYRK